MKKLLTLILCFCMLLLSGCGTTVADIEKYERENNAIKIAEPLKKLADSKSTETVENVHAVATMALVRMAPTNSDAKKFLEENYYKIERYERLKNILDPFVFKLNIEKLSGHGVDSAKGWAESAKFRAPESDSQAVALLDKIIKKCEDWEKLDEYYKTETKNALGEEGSVEAISNKIKTNKKAAIRTLVSIVNKTGFNADNIQYFSNEEILYLVNTSIYLNPDLQAKARIVKALASENTKLESRITQIISLTATSTARKISYDKEIAAMVSKLQMMVLNKSYENNTNTATDNATTTASTQEHGYIIGSDVNVRNSASQQSNVIDCLAKDTRVEILSYIQTQGKYNWYKVKLSDGRVGFVAHPYIRK